MTKDLLWRGMLAGILAALLATVFARVCAEPLVDRAIAFEASHEAHEAGHHHGDDEAEEPVSRDTQKGIGLATAVVLYGAAVGGIFSLIFAYGYGRVGRIGPRSLAMLIAALGFLIIVIVPALKYPPNPPAVGQPDTIQMRTGAYFAMIAISLAALFLASRVRAMALEALGSFNALIVAGLAYVVVIAVAQIGLPRIDEVPTDFPATLLWNFRVVSIGMQLILWTVLGLAFGWMAERCLLKASSGR
jgi:predicted cobalt transporter CbtA